MGAKITYERKSNCSQVLCKLAVIDQLTKLKENTSDEVLLSEVA